VGDKTGGSSISWPRYKMGCAGSQAFHEYVLETDAAEGAVSTDIPFAIEGDKIGGISIRWLLNSNDRWTQALKYMLTDLKWLLLWVIKRQGLGGVTAIETLAAMGAGPSTSPVATAPRSDGRRQAPRLPRPPPR
jgi:Apg6 BARA domain